MDMSKWSCAILSFIFPVSHFTAAAGLPTDFPQTAQQQPNPRSLYDVDSFSRTTIKGPSAQALVNSSGVTWNSDEDLLYVIHNNENVIHVFDHDIRGAELALQKIRLVGWSDSSITNDEDLEDLVYLGKNASGRSEIAMVNEGTPGKGAEVYICEINAWMGSLNRADCDRIHVEIAVAKTNKGAEGLAYDSIQRKFFIAIEGNEAGRNIKLASFARPYERDFEPETSGAGRVAQVQAIEPFDTEAKLGRLAPDISAVIWSAKKQRLYVLSHVGERILDVDLQGTIHGVFPLPRGVQFEGLCLDLDEALVLISEPNLSFRYSVVP
jgi:uncharacterized protein YjiK